MIETYSDALSRLKELQVECSQHGWDGNDSVAINRVAVERADRFISALPNGVEFPEFGPEPDGAISLDWIWTRDCILSISIGTNDRLAFAWLDGTDKGHGVVHFDDKTVPPLILELINRLDVVSSPSPNEKT